MFISVTEKTEGNTTIVSLEDVPDINRPKIQATHKCVLCSANLPTKVKYTDVLILEQFMRDDGTVLPRELTGLFPITRYMFIIDSLIQDYVVNNK